MSTDQKSPRDVIEDVTEAMLRPAGDWEGTPTADIVIQALKAAGWKIVRDDPLEGTR